MFALTKASVSLQEWWLFCHWWPNQCGSSLSDLTSCFKVNSFGGDIKTRKCKTYFHQHCYSFVSKRFFSVHLKAPSDISPLPGLYALLKPLMKIYKSRTHKLRYSLDGFSNKSYILLVLGGRVSSEKKVLLITDGQSNIQKQLTIPKANNLKNMGVEIYVVAVGSYISGIGEMVKVAGSSNPFKLPEDFLFRVHKYHGLWEVTELIIQKVAATGKYTILSPYPSPC